MLYHYLWMIWHFLLGGIIMEDKKNFDGLVVYALDLDGTLFEDRYPELGPPKLKVIEKAKKVREEGAKLILWTCRSGVHLEEGVAACKELGLEFDCINDNLPELIEKFGDNSRKISAFRYIDDRAITPEDWVKQENKEETNAPVHAAASSSTSQLTSTPNSKEVSYPARVHMVRRVCSCGGEMVYAGNMVSINPSQYIHKCKSCSRTENFPLTYPRLTYETDE